jgi:hypothetical protein
VFRERDGRREMHRRQLEICVFTHLALALRTCDVAVVGSEQYADYRNQLLPWDQCEPLLDDYCAKLGLPRTAKFEVQDGPVTVNFWGKLFRHRCTISAGGTVLTDSTQPWNLLAFAVIFGAIGLDLILNLLIRRLI